MSDRRLSRHIRGTRIYQGQHLSRKLTPPKISPTPASHTLPTLIRQSEPAQSTPSPPQYCHLVTQSVICTTSSYTPPASSGQRNRRRAYLSATQPHTHTHRPRRRCSTPGRRHTRRGRALPCHPNPPHVLADRALATHVAVLHCAIQKCTAQARTPPIKPSSPVFPTQAPAVATHERAEYVLPTRMRRTSSLTQPAHAVAVLPCAIQPCTAQPRTPRVKPSSPVFPTQAQASGLARKRWSTRRAHAHGRSTRGRRQIRWKQPAHSAAADAAYQVPVASLPDPGTASDIARKGRSNRRAHAHGSSTRGRRQIRWRQLRDSASADAAYRVAVTSLPDTGAGLKPSTEAQEYQASPRPRAQHARRPDGGSYTAQPRTSRIKSSSPVFPT